MMGIGFVNAALLGGLGLIAVPILIHWLSRRRFRRLDWGAMQFLLLAEKENRRRLRFEQWLLVALRCLAMALLALLVARPYAEPALAAALLGGRADVHRVLLIDDSASLGHTRGGAPDFARIVEASQSVLQWLSDAGGAPEVSVYRTSDPADPLHTGPLTATDHAVLLEKLAALAVRPLAAEPRAALATIASALAARSDEATQIYVFSDFQRTDWIGDATRAVEPFGPLLDADLPDVRLSLVRLPVPRRDNLAIEDVRFERPHAIAGLPNVVRVTAANYTRRPVLDVGVRVAAGELASVPLRIDQIEPGERKEISAELLLSDAGPVVITAQLEQSDALAVDDRRGVTAQVREALRVLLVDGAPSADPTQSETYFARSALAPLGPSTSGIEVEVVSLDGVEGMPLARFDCIVLANVPAPRAGWITVLNEFVAGGGGLAVFLGDQVRDPQRYNAAFESSDGALLPLQLAQRAEPAEAVGLRASVVEHPVTALIPAEGAATGVSASFHTYWQLAGANADSARDVDDTTRGAARVLARFADDNSAPALVEARHGRGRILLFASTLDADWNNWPRTIDGSYVVTLLEMVQYLARRNVNPAAFVSGESLRWRVPPAEYETAAILRAPGGGASSALTGSIKQSGAATPLLEFNGPRATALGVYQLRLQPRTEAAFEQPLAVNLPARESDPTVVTAADLRGIANGLPVEIVEIDAGLSPRQEAARRELWPLLLVALVALLLCEQTLAWWFGMPRTHRARFVDPRQWFFGKRAA